MGQQLVLQAARIAHFPSGGHFQVTIVDEQAEKKVASPQVPISQPGSGGKYSDDPKAISKTPECKSASLTYIRRLTINGSCWAV